MTPSTHSPWRQYAFRRTPSRTKPGPLGVADRPLVERVDLELEAVEAEVGHAGGAAVGARPRRRGGVRGSSGGSRARRVGRSGCACSRRGSPSPRPARRRPRRRSGRSPPARAPSARSPRAAPRAWSHGGRTGTGRRPRASSARRGSRRRPGAPGGWRRSRSRGLDGFGLGLRLHETRPSATPLRISASPSSIRPVTTSSSRNAPYRSAVTGIR